MRWAPVVTSAHRGGSAKRWAGVAAGLALSSSALLASAHPASAMQIKKDDNCITYVTPTVQYNGGAPTVDQGKVTVNNCVTVSP